MPLQAKIAFFSDFLTVIGAVSLLTQGIEMPGKGFCAHKGAMTSHPENTIPVFLEGFL